MPGRFGQILAQLTPNTQPRVQVQQGDTLIGLVKAQHRQQGQPITENQAFRLAHQLAADNRIANPNLIQPGQRLDFGRLNLPNSVNGIAASALEVPTSAKLALEQLRPTPQAAATPSTAHVVLDKVLERAVDKGFIPSMDLAAVRGKILQLADKYNFQPDDFARLSLMESGGMNPQASNGHCHGIIQFCDGPARGAAAVGYQNKPKAILGLSLFKQLDLVDQYFSKVGMPPKSEKQGLDDLYLSILSPAARSESRPDAPLPIGGPQASLLHVGNNQRNPITRNSLVQGLYQLSETLLSANIRRNAPARMYAQAANPPDTDLD